MNVSKRTLARLENVYAVTALDLDGAVYLAAATEGQGPGLLFSPPDWKPSAMWEGPGGTMTVVPIPGRRACLAVERFFPVFQSEEAGITHAAAPKAPTGPWRVRRVIDLPFVHRIAVVRVGPEPVLVAATLCAGKEFRDDWSQPGAVYVAGVPREPGDPWTLQTVLDGIVRNHGMHRCALNGESAVLVSGREGLFRLRVPEQPGGGWSPERLIDREISDAWVFDLDGDGRDEIVTIEPFHGDTIAVYAHRQGRWERRSERPVEFGHVVWAGLLLGRPAIIAGARGGDKAISLIRPNGTDIRGPGRLLIDEGVGPTQIAVLPNADARCARILSANHAAGEVALYELTP